MSYLLPEIPLFSFLLCKFIQLDIFRSSSNLQWQMTSTVNQTSICDLTTYVSL